MTRQETIELLLSLMVNSQLAGNHYSVGVCFRDLKELKAFNADLVKLIDSTPAFLLPVLYKKQQRVIDSNRGYIRFGIHSRDFRGVGISTLFLSSALTNKQRDELSIILCITTLSRANALIADFDSE